MEGAVKQSDDKELRELQASENWDWTHAEAQPPSTRPGIILRVRFDSANAEQVLAAAEAAGISAIEFVRRAAIARATTHKRN